MAKKEKQAPAPEGEEGQKDGEGGEATAESGKKGLGKFLSKEFLFSKKMLMFGAPALLVVLLGIGAGTYFMFFSGHGEDEAKLAEAAEPVPVTPPEVAFYDVPNILVNIQSPDGAPAYLKISLSLELNNEEEKAGVEALKDRMVDQFQGYLRELRMDDLKGSAGIARVKEELLRRVNVAAAPYKVRDVLLQEMIVQ
jgi:flagellar FliL protein